MQQKTALRALKSGHNVFLTGSAGAGKTYLLNQYIDYLRAHRVNLAVTASTGIAATHLGGMTVHSWSGIGIRDTLDEKDLSDIAKKKPVRERVRDVRVLIIDEISMLSANTLACVDQIIRHLKVSPLPFGGVQVIFSGDFFQLPPVNAAGAEAREKFAFMSPMWLQANLKICYLKESHRHQDDELLQVLNEIRSGEVSAHCRKMLGEKIKQTATETKENALKLHTHNANVDTANTHKLAQLSTSEREFQARTSGVQTLVDALKKNVMAPEVLALKQNAQVMFVKNSPDENYINGTLGTVIGFSQEGWPQIKTFDEHTIQARPAEWNILNEQGEIIASYIQVPLRLAWAITVHKSQGMTLPRATVDLAKTFEMGQGYVALSRVQTWDGLQLIGYNERALQVEPLAVKADRRFQALSAQVEGEILSHSEQALQTEFAQHIRKCGGSTEPNPELIKRNRVAKQKSTNAKPSSHLQTKQLIEAGNTLTEIADKRGFTIGTILSHLRALHETYPDLDLSACKPPQEEIAVIQSAINKCQKNANKEDFTERGYLKLSKVYLELDRKYSYERIRLAKIFM